MSKWCRPFTLLAPYSGSEFLNLFACDDMKFIPRQHLNCKGHLHFTFPLHNPTPHPHTMCLYYEAVGACVSLFPMLKTLARANQSTPSALLYLRVSPHETPLPGSSPGGSREFEAGTALARIRKQLLN